MPLVSVIIINYNSKSLLQGCFENLLEQTYKNLEIIVIDVASTDESHEYAKKIKNAKVVLNKDNLGYGRGANLGINLSKGEFVMTINPDILMQNDFIENCVSFMNKHKDAAGISGKIFFYDIRNNKKTNIIDTLGFYCFKNRRVVDDAQGIEDKGQFALTRETFGVSGACPFFRRSALEEIRNNNEFYDGDYFMYKEDIDLSWRLRLKGWKIYYLPEAVAYHGRGTGVLRRVTNIEVARNRSKLSNFQKFYSYRNQRLMQIKNEFIRDALRNFFPIIFKEILILAYGVFEPIIFKSFFELLRQIPVALKKRKLVMGSVKVAPEEIEKWFAHSNKDYLKHIDENPGN